MEGDFKIKLTKFDTIDLLDNNTLVLGDGDLEFKQVIGWQNARKIALQYLKQADDKERTEVFKELYDGLSYEELEDKYLEASNEVDNLKAEIENLRQSKDRKVFDY